MAACKARDSARKFRSPEVVAKASRLVVLARASASRRSAICARQSRYWRRHLNSGTRSPSTNAAKPVSAARYSFCSSNASASSKLPRMVNSSEDRSSASLRKTPSGRCNRSITPAQSRNLAEQIVPFDFGAERIGVGERTCRSQRARRGCHGNVGQRDDRGWGAGMKREMGNVCRVLEHVSGGAVGL